MKFRKLLIGLLVSVALGTGVSTAVALTSGQTYTVSISTVSSTGALVATDSTTATTADSNGKISFTFSNVPTSSSCNFMTVTVADSNGNTVRRSIVPCPASGTTIPFGVSTVTGKQTDALLQGFASAGTDDPILAVFGMAIVRSPGITAPELVFMANLAKQGISGTNGFVDYLANNGVTAAQLAAYRSAIVTRLGDPNSGYTKLIKESVDDATGENSEAERAKRGEAAGLLLKILVDAATDAGFAQDRIIEAFNAMGAIVVPLMSTAVADGNLTAATKQSIDSSIGGGINRLNAERNIAKYSAALTALGGSSTDVGQFQTAATNLGNTMATAFQNFDKVFDGTETAAEVQAAQTTLDNTINTAFGTFMSATAASNARLTIMANNINTAAGSSVVSANDFKFFDQNGNQVNWPIMRVVPTDWVSSVVSAGGSVSYTRDTTSIPANAQEWIGSCSNTSYQDRTNCQSNGATWTVGRHDFSSYGSWGVLFGLEEDVMILEHVRWAAEQSAGQDFSARETLEKNFTNSVAGLASNISGTTDGSAAIASGVKSALVTLVKSPQL